MINIKGLCIAGLAAAVITLPTVGHTATASAASMTHSESACAAALDVVNDLKAGEKTEALKDLTALLPTGAVELAIADLLSGNVLAALTVIEDGIPLPGDLISDILSGNVLEAVSDLLGTLHPGAVETAIADILAGNITGAEGLVLSLCP